jgi:fatty acid hydroxylase domain-containing protein 2
LPSLSEFFSHALFFIVVEEIVFFYSHLLLHQRFFYDRVHRIHHEFRSPIALAAAYAHPIEMLLSNIVPLMLGPLLARAHVVTLLSWFFVGVITTQIHHSGYEFPWHAFDPTGQPSMHDYHHEFYHANYGLLGVLDRLHGTYKVRDQPKITNKVD